jgi:hypothetical protein
MTSPHRHFEAGGDPALGPAADLANQPRGPHVGNDFPDVPEGNRPGHSSSGRDPDQPDLDQFAERLGLGDADDGASGSEPDRPRGGLRTRLARSAALGADGMARAFHVSARALERFASWLRPDERSS